jgi:hypothetical protein
LSRENQRPFGSRAIPKGLALLQRVGSATAAKAKDWLCYCCLGSPSPEGGGEANPRGKRKPKVTLRSKQTAKVYYQASGEKQRKVKYDFYYVFRYTKKDKMLY